MADHPSQTENTAAEQHDAAGFGNCIATTTELECAIKLIDFGPGSFIEGVPLQGYKTRPIFIQIETNITKSGVEDVVDITGGDADGRKMRRAPTIVVVGEHRRRSHQAGWTDVCIGGYRSGGGINPGYFRCGPVTVG